MDIATNAVLSALLIQVSGFVEDVGLPIPTPLQQANVKEFVVGTTWSREGPELECYLGYAGGYEFRHSHGCILSFNTRDSYMHLQDPRDLEKLSGTFRYDEAQCLAKVRGVFERLGYTNVSLLQPFPQVEVPQGRLRVPRYIFRWLSPGSVKFADAVVEVNAERLSVENLSMPNPAFWRTAWPVTFGTTNVYIEPDPLQPTRQDLKIVGVSANGAREFMLAALPEISSFCAAIGTPAPASVQESDVVPGGSEVSVKNGRLTASLRLRGGYLVVYYAGHVWAVHAPDLYYNKPWRRQFVKESAEYRDATRLTKLDAVKRVRALLIEALRLPEKDLFLSTDPVFTMVPDPGQTNGIRRYSFYWHAPETLAGGASRTGPQVLPDVSVSVELDAVSGSIKALNLFSKSLERPDPIPRGGAR